MKTRARLEVVAHSYALHSSDCPLSFSQVTDFCSPRHFPALKSDWPLSFTRVTRHFELQYFAHFPPSTSANFLAVRIFVEISDGVQFTPQHDCSTFIHLNFADYIFGGTDKNALVA